MKPEQQPDGSDPGNNGVKTNGESITFEHPEAALSVLEADQLVSAKQRTRFGRRKLSLTAKLVLWGLRIYVVVMLLIVLLSVLRTLPGGH